MEQEAAHAWKRSYAQEESASTDYSGEEGDFGSARYRMLPALLFVGWAFILAVIMAYLSVVCARRVRRAVNSKRSESKKTSNQLSPHGPRVGHSHKSSDDLDHWSSSEKIGQASSDRIGERSSRVNHKRDEMFLSTLKGTSTRSPFDVNDSIIKPEVIEANKTAEGASKSASDAHSSRLSYPRDFAASSRGEGASEGSANRSSSSKIADFFGVKATVPYVAVQSSSSLKDSSSRSSSSTTSTRHSRNDVAPPSVSDWPILYDSSRLTAPVVSRPAAPGPVAMPASTTAQSRIQAIADKYGANSVSNGSVSVANQSTSSHSTRPSSRAVSDASASSSNTSQTKLACDWYGYPTSGAQFAVAAALHDQKLAGSLSAPSSLPYFGLSNLYMSQASPLTSFVATVPAKQASWATAPSSATEKSETSNLAKPSTLEAVKPKKTVVPEPKIEYFESSEEEEEEEEYEEEEEEEEEEAEEYEEAEEDLEEDLEEEPEKDRHEISAEERPGYQRSAAAASEEEESEVDVYEDFSDLDATGKEKESSLTSKSSTFNASANLTAAKTASSSEKKRSSSSQAVSDALSPSKPDVANLSKEAEYRIQQERHLRKLDEALNRKIRASKYAAESGISETSPIVVDDV